MVNIKCVNTYTPYTSAASYTPARPLHYPVIPPMCAANFVAVQSSPKPATWATLGTIDQTTAAVAAAATDPAPTPAPQANTHPLCGDLYAFWCQT